MASFLLTAVIGILVYLVVVLDKNVIRNNRFLEFANKYDNIFIFLLICGLPLILCYCVYINERFGYAQNFGENWCWIKVADYEDEGSWAIFGWRMIGGKAVELICFITICATYLPIVVKIRRVSNSGYKSSLENKENYTGVINNNEQRLASISKSEKNKTSSITRLSLIPGLFILLRLPSMVRTVVDVR